MKTNFCLISCRQTALHQIVRGWRYERIRAQLGICTHPSQLQPICRDGSSGHSPLKGKLGVLSGALIGTSARRGGATCCASAGTYTAPRPGLDMIWDRHHLWRIESFAHFNLKNGNHVFSRRVSGIVKLVFVGLNLLCSFLVVRNFHVLSDGSFPRIFHLYYSLVFSIQHASV